jgi:hypothetical protein
MKKFFFLPFNLLFIQNIVCLKQIINFGKNSAQKDLN